MTARARVGVAFLGVLLVQLAWILVVSPYAGMDEHEHAYKAAAVARGDWSATHPVTESGWGEFVRVPPGMVRAARPQCDLLKYVSRDSCVPSGTGADGLVSIASSASRYNPAYYAVVGLPTLVVDGYHALYAMRIASAVLCALFVAAAFGAAGTARTRWPSLGVLLVLTPTALYSTAIVAPNGVEICAAGLLWACLLALGRTDLSPALRDRLVLGATVASVPLLVVRTLGPLWWVLTLALCAVLLGRRRSVEIVRTRAARLSAPVLVLAGGYAVVWDLLARTNAVPSKTITVTSSDWASLPGEYLSWFFQAVAAMPFRNEMVPLAVYAVSFGLIGTLLAVAVHRAAVRERLVLAAVFVLASGIGLGITVVALPHAGYIWQGRYFMPLTIGLFFVVGRVFDRSAHGRLLTGPLPTAAAVVAFAAANLISGLHVLDRQSSGPLAGTGHWLQPQPWVVAALVAAGSSALLAAVLGVPTTPAPTDDDVADELATTIAG